MSHWGNYILTWTQISHFTHLNQMLQMSKVQKWINIYDRFTLLNYFATNHACAFDAIFTSWLFTLGVLYVVIGQKLFCCFRKFVFLELKQNLWQQWVIKCAMRYDYWMICIQVKMWFRHHSNVWIVRGLGGWTSQLFSQPPNTLSNYVLGESSIYYIHRIYIIIFVGLRQSKSSAPS